MNKNRHPAIQNLIEQLRSVRDNQHDIALLRKYLLPRLESICKQFFIEVIRSRQSDIVLNSTRITTDPDSREAEFLR